MMLFVIGDYLAGRTALCTSALSTCLRPARAAASVGTTFGWLQGSLRRRAAIVACACDGRRS